MGKIIMKKILFIIAAHLCFGQSLAGDKLPPVAGFREATSYHLLICRIETQTALNEVKLGTIDSPWAKIGACLKTGRSEAKKFFGPALAKVSKKPAASNLLKDYYGSWLTALNGVMPEPGERKIDYERRQSAADTKSDEYWNRFEVEAGI
jgi:hypothetical protein